MPPPSSPYYHTAFVRIENVQECAGKIVVVAIRHFDVLGIRFTDGTYYWAVAESTGCDDEASINDYHCYPDNTYALKLGIIGQSEYDRAEAKMKADREEFDRAVYERMKAKFEPKGNPNAS